MKKQCVSEVVDSLDHWNFSHIKRYLVDKEGISESKASELESEYKKYIALRVADDTEGLYPISSEVDPFWHAHILHTKDYVGMCEFLGVEYIHHQPATDDVKLELAPHYKHFIGRYENHFGKPNAMYWPENAQVCGSSCH